MPSLGHDESPGPCASSGRTGPTCWDRTKVVGKLWKLESVAVRAPAPAVLGEAAARAAGRGTSLFALLEGDFALHCAPPAPSLCVLSRSLVRFRAAKSTRSSRTKLVVRYRALLERSKARRRITTSARLEASPVAARCGTRRPLFESASLP